MQNGIAFWGLPIAIWHGKVKIQKQEEVINTLNKICTVKS